MNIALKFNTKFQLLQIINFSLLREDTENYLNSDFSSRKYANLSQQKEPLIRKLKRRKKVE